MIGFLLCTFVFMMLCFFISTGFRLAGLVRSQFVRLFACGSCLETFCCLSCVFSTRCVIFRISDDLLHHYDLCYDSFWDTLLRNVVNNFNGRMFTICSEHCVGNVGLWDHLIHFFVRELLTSQTERTTSRLLGNAISPARHCDFRVLREVAGLYPW